MTHDELLKQVTEVWNWYEDQEPFKEVAPYLLALRAVVELCGPKWNDFTDSIYWKQEILKAIEKELQ